MSRKASFLDSEEWKIVPWQKHPELKTGAEQSLDTLCCFPGLLQDIHFIDRATKRGLNTTDQRKSVIRRLTRFLGDIFQWRWNWEAAHPNVVREGSARTSSGQAKYIDGRPMFEPALQYNDSALSVSMIYYNTSLTGALHLVRLFNDAQIIKDALAVVPPVLRPQKANPLLLPHENITILDPVWEICRSMDCHLQQGNIGIRAIALSSAMRFCFLTFWAEQRKQELSWVTGILELIADRSGFEFARYLVSLRTLGLDQSKIEGINIHLEGLQE
ncbi:MAG: hypothetical protein LQ342_007142 [Letrouitia transgressa]|nr:MAG: hypothetical protein LQ342_007142 [Letrouitia transgressa]